MFDITTNLPLVAGFLGRLDAGYGAGVVGQLGELDTNLFRAAAQGALTAAMEPGEEQWLRPLLDTLSIALPGTGLLQVSLGRPPTVLDRALEANSSLKKMRRQSAPREDGMLNAAQREQMRQLARGVTADDLAADVSAARNLVDLWIHTPVGPDRDAPEAGKDLTTEDAEELYAPAKDGDTLLLDRLLRILGLKPARKRSPEMDAAAESLAGRLHKFAASQLGESDVIPESRLRDLFRAVLAAWRALLLQHLPAAARAAVLEARE